MIPSTPVRVCTAFERRKAKGRRIAMLERPVQVATILIWTLITDPQLVQQVAALGMEEVPEAHLTTPRTRYPRRSHRVRGRAESYNLPLLPHLSQHLSHPRRLNLFTVIPLFF